jgi:catechol 2,3-dioxygenase-like lactoylglutathione lyase family enzyme
MALGFIQEVTASVGVTDLERSIAWYQDVLGFAPLHRGDGTFCEMTTHMRGVNVVLSTVERVKPDGGTTNVWSVTDIAAAKAELDRRGIRQDGDIRTIPDVVKLLTFYDPDGNTMMLAQSLMD